MSSPLPLSRDEEHKPLRSVLLDSRFYGRVLVTLSEEGVTFLRTGPSRGILVVT